MTTARVLVADDNDIIRAGIRELLSRAPEFEVVAEAEDGREAARLASLTEPDIILLDLRMPDIDGPSAARYIASRRPESKIVVVTADDSEHAEQLARAVGAVAIVTKDRCVTNLIPTLREVVGGRRPLQDSKPSNG